MNKSSSSASSSSPPFTTLPTPLTTAPNTTSAAINQRNTPSVIPLEYNYRMMSPSSLSQLRRTSTASNATLHTSRPQTSTTQLDFSLYYGTQYNSLFGDPVPPQPPPDFLSSQFDSRAAQIFHATSTEVNGSSEEETPFGRAVKLQNNSGRLFSKVPYTSLLRQRSSNASIERNVNNFPAHALPRLQPPDIQILPNSSGGSSGSGGQRDSPNYALLGPNDPAPCHQTHSLYDIDGPADISEFSETVTINDASGRREYSEASRRMSNFTADFKANVGSFNTSPMVESPTTAQTMERQFSNESYSSSEWFRPAMHDFPEFSKMPNLRPSSKNVMSIKRDEMPTQHSPVAAMINDSNGSSCGSEERNLDMTQTLAAPTVPLDILAPQRPPEPSSELLESLDPNYRIPVEDTGTIFSPSSSPSIAPPPLPPPSSCPSHENLDRNTDLEDQKSINREVSPAILRDSIVTGSDYRVDNFRLHKKTSFTIISDRSPQSSRAHTPSINYAKPVLGSYSHAPAMTRTPSVTPTLTPTPTPTPTSITTSKPTAKPRHNLKRKSLTSTELRVPQLLTQPPTSDDSPRPSVQFDMTGRYSPSKMPQKGILQHRESLSSSQETPLPMRLSPLPPPVPRRRNSILPRMPSSTQSTAIPFGDQQKFRSYETLPLITDPYRTAIPRIHRSSFDLRESAIFPPGALPRPLKPNPNPTRKQRGLLRIINSADSVSRIPLRSNWTASAEDLALLQRRRSSLSTIDLHKRRRSSSTTPERRSSTQTTSDRRSSNLSSVTTSDFSYRRPSLTNIQPMNERRKSIIPGVKSSPTTPKRRQSVVEPGVSKKRSIRMKIAKPTTLSPIIGTPNKDSSSPQSPARSSALNTLLNASETLSDTASRRESLSRIPIRNAANSRSDSRLSSHPGSQTQSRSSSPLKENAIHSPISGRTSRAASSRSPSQATVRNESRPTSRAESRAMISRSSSRASTRPISRGPPSRSSSRPNSRLDQARTTADGYLHSRTDRARDTANARSNSRLSTSSPIGRAASVSPTRKRTAAALARRKSVSLSPNAMRRSDVKRHSISPTAKRRNNNSSRPLERRSSRSRIPTRAKSDLTNGAKRTRSPSKTKKKTEELQRMTSARRSVPPQSRKLPTSAKKAPSSVRKAESSVKRTMSSVSKAPATATKKQPNNLQKTGKNIKQDQQKSSQKKNATGKDKAITNGKRPSKIVSGKQEPPANKKKTGSGTGEAKELKKQSSTKQLSKTNDAKRTANGAGADQKGGAMGIGKEKKTSTAVESGSAVNDSASIAVTAAATGALISGMKRQPSAVSLIRMGSRLSLLSRKRPDSSLSSHITEEVEESTDPSDHQSDTAGTPKIPKVSSSSQLVTSDGLPAEILEKSQKTSDNIQKTVTNAPDEIQRKLHENLTDLKSLEQDVGRVSDGAVSPTASIMTVVENRASKTSDSSTGAIGNKSPQPAGQPIEPTVSVLNTSRSSGNADSGGANAAERVSASTAISVLPEVDCESANFQNFELGIEDKNAGGGVGATGATDGIESNTLTDEPSSNSGVDGITKHRQSPDGQGGSTAGSDGGRTGSRELLDAPDDVKSKGCCRCCARICMPCRRSRCLRCCRRNKKHDHDHSDDSEDRPVLSATSSTTTTNLEVIDEKTGKKKKKKNNACWEKLNCFKKKIPTSSTEDNGIDEDIQRTTETMRGVTPPISMGPTPPKPQGKCGACLRKVFCCRSANKVETTTSDDEEQSGKQCACFPCCKKKRMGSESGSRAWQDPEQGITATDVGEGLTSAATQDGCCKRFWRRICCCCCRKKPTPVPSNSRRASMKAPPPPAEDTRRKLHNDLIEYTSKMKGAIPVLPLYLAWFCAICNTVFPGLGTLFSGIFCICVGIPRFSQYDSAKARLGSFIINTIVAASQLFCVLFCFVGWGWSIWWGTIMLKCAKKLSKIRKVERLEMEEEQRQAAVAKAAAKAEVIGHSSGATETTKT